MLDDLLKKIKNALPEKIRAKVFKSKDDEDEELDEDELDEDDEGEEEDDEVTEERTQTDLSDDSEEDDDEDDEEDDEDDEELDEEEEKKKKKQKIIRIVAVLFIVYLAFDTFMAPTDGPEDVAVEDTPPPAKPKGVTGIVEEEAPKKPRGIVEEPTEQEPVAQTEPEPAPQEPVVRAEPEPAPQEPVVQTEPEPAQQEPVAQTEPPVVSGGESTSVGMVEQPDTLEVEQVEEVDSRQKEVSMMKQIVSAVNEKLEYVEPPDYLKSGRGLVYNCEGRHWACVERESYFQCRDNMRWSAQEKKAPECYTKDVYATMDDCRVVQIHYINTAEPTDFCESP